MLWADFRLPKPKALRREFIEFIREGGTVGPGGKRASEGLEGKGKDDMREGEGKPEREGRCAYRAGRCGEGADAGCGPVSRVRGGECEY